MNALQEKSTPTNYYFSDCIFLPLWEKNKVSAIDKLHLFTTSCNDSCPGSDLHHIVHEKKGIDSEEINIAIKEWFQLQFGRLSQDLTITSQEYLKMNLLQIYSYASYDTQHKDLCNWISETFYQHYNLLTACYGKISDKRADKTLKMLFHCVASAEESYREHLRNYLRTLLWDNNMSLRYVFRSDEMLFAAYYHEDTKTWDRGVNRFLKLFGQKTKQAIKHDTEGKNTPIKGMINILRMILYRFIHPNEGVMEATSESDAWVEKWLKENNVL